MSESLHAILDSKPYGYVMAPSEIFILLSSFALSGILSIFPMNSLCYSLLNYFNTILFFFKHLLQSQNFCTSNSMVLSAVSDKFDVW